MPVVLAIAAGGALGAVLRHYMNIAVTAILGGGFPYGIMAVNITGSFIMGSLITYFALAGEASQTMRLFLTVGLLGGFTTFSSFSLDAVTLIERGQVFAAAIYIGGSVVLALGGLCAGMMITRMILT